MQNRPASRAYHAARKRPITKEMNWRERITVNPDQCGGRPCIRGMRIRVIDVLDLLADGLNRGQILKEMPDLVSEDVEAAVRYASSRLDHPVLAA
jgi:uncharacterized protein (DUF433 family)